MAHTTQANAYATAVELAKIICANPACTIYPSEMSANDIVDFIDTLTKRLSTDTDSKA